MRTRPITTLLAALALAGLLGACGDDDSTAAGSASGDGSAADSDDGDSTGGGGDAATDQDVQDAMLEYAECMREHGIDMPDPETGGDGGVVFGPGPADQDASQAEQEEYTAADEACSPILDEVSEDAPQIDPREQAELQDQMVQVAECMRERGHDMPDPEVNDQGQVQIGVGAGVEAGEANFEQFQEDMRACQDEVGVAGPGSGAGPGGGAGVGG